MVGRRRFWPLSASAQDWSTENCVASFGHCQVDPGPGCDGKRSELNMTNRNRIIVELHEKGGIRLCSDQDADFFLVYNHIPDRIFRLDRRVVAIGRRAVDKSLGNRTS